MPLLTASWASLVGALLTATPVDAAPLPTGAPPQADGRQLAAELGCGGCHAGMPQPSLARTRSPGFGPGATPLPAAFVFEYLADPRRRRNDIGLTRMPDFTLDERERLALALFLGTSDGSAGGMDAVRARHGDVDAALGRRIFDQLGCAGCHQGALDAPSPRGPDLSREGVRVGGQWLRAFLQRPTSVRRDGHPGAPGSRMPDFRLTTEEAEALADSLGGLGDRFAEIDVSPLSPPRARRAEALLQRRLACLGCHEVGAEGGRIGPSLNGLPERVQPAFVLEMILDPGRAAPGGLMPHQPIPEADARRLARYLWRLDGVRQQVERRSLADADHPALGSLGDHYRDQGDFERGETAYRKGLELRPDDAGFQRALGLLKTSVGEFPEAVRLLRASLATDSVQPLGWVNLGIALVGAGDTAGAAEAYRRALALDPPESVAHFNLGNLEQRRERLEGAAREYLAAIEEDPGLGRAHFEPARVYIRLERFADGLQHARPAVEFLPDHGPSRQMLQDLTEVLGDRGGGP